MSDEKDPGRLLDTADDPLLRELLDAGASELPSADRLAQVAAKLPPGGGGGGGGGASTATKLALGLGTLGIVAAIVTLTLSPSAPALAPMPVPALSASASATSAPTTPPTPSSVPALAPSAPPRPKPVVSSDTPSAESEVQMLKRAQDALRTDPARALAACNEHAARYPRGDLAQEREVLAVDALTRLGRNDQAVRRAQAFVAAHPDSSHRARLERLVGQLL
jgi:hypothetical protein